MQQDYRVVACGRNCYFDVVENLTMQSFSDLRINSEQYPSIEFFKKKIIGFNGFVGGTVYTAGYYNDGTKDIPCCWTGTTHTVLDSTY